MKKLAFLGLKLSMGNETVATSFQNFTKSIEIDDEHFEPNWEMRVFHYDQGKEAQLHYEGEVDHQIFKIINTYKPDVVVYAGPAEGKCRPQTDTLLWIKDRAKTIAFICDGGCQGWHSIIKEYAEKNVFDLMVNGDSNTNWPHRPQDLTCHGLVDPSYYSKPAKKDIKFGAIMGLGSKRRQDETKWLTENAGLVLGERSEKWGDYQKYADFMLRTKVTINFPEGGGDGSFYQLKYRVMEAGFAHCALFERRNPITSSLLSPVDDYFEYEMVEEIPGMFTLYDEEELERRAANLHKKVTERFRPEPVWQEMLKRIGYGT